MSRFGRVPFLEVLRTDGVTLWLHQDLIRGGVAVPAGPDDVLVITRLYFTDLLGDNSSMEIYGELGEVMQNLNDQALGIGPHIPLRTLYNEALFTKKAFDDLATAGQ